MSRDHKELQDHKVQQALVEAAQALALRARKVMLVPQVHKETLAQQARKVPPVLELLEQRALKVTLEQPDQLDLRVTLVQPDQLDLRVRQEQQELVLLARQVRKATLEQPDRQGPKEVWVLLARQVRKVTLEQPDRQVHKGLLELQDQGQ